MISERRRFQGWQHQDWKLTLVRYWGHKQDREFQKNREFPLRADILDLQIIQFLTALLLVFGQQRNHSFRETVAEFWGVYFGFFNICCKTGWCFSYLSDLSSWSHLLGHRIWIFCSSSEIGCINLWAVSAFALMIGTQMLVDCLVIFYGKIQKLPFDNIGLLCYTWKLEILDGPKSAFPLLNPCFTLWKRSFQGRKKKCWEYFSSWIRTAHGSTSCQKEN